MAKRVKLEVNEFGFIIAKRVPRVFKIKYHVSEDSLIEMRKSAKKLKD